MLQASILYSSTALADVSVLRSSTDIAAIQNSTRSDMPSSDAAWHVDTSTDQHPDAVVQLQHLATRQKARPSLDGHDHCLGS